MSESYARRPIPRRISVLAALVGLISAIALLTGPPAQAAPPTPVSAATARSYLASLTVSAEGSMSGYSRSLFPHWSAQYGNCNTREVVLKRDGTNVVTNGACQSVSGRWYSAFDGVTLTSASSLDIDHMVPLAEAWRSGASGWTTSKRQQFANDLTRPALIAVSASSNRSKGDQDPASWMPTRTAYHCLYARMWVHTKYYWNLRVDSAEKSALQSTLNGC